MQRTPVGSASHTQHGPALHCPALPQRDSLPPGQQGSRYSPRQPLRLIACPLALCDTLRPSACISSHLGQQRHLCALLNRGSPALKQFTYPLLAFWCLLIFVCLTLSLHGRRTPVSSTPRGSEPRDPLHVGYGRHPHAGAAHRLARHGAAGAGETAGERGPEQRWPRDAGQ